MNVNWSVDQSMDPAIVMGCNAGMSLRIKKKRVAVVVLMHTRERRWGDFSPACLLFLVPGNGGG
jgi:hypothetical protein